MFAWLKVDVEARLFLSLLSKFMLVGSVYRLLTFGLTFGCQTKEPLRLIFDSLVSCLGLFGSRIFLIFRKFERDGFVFRVAVF